MGTGFKEFIFYFKFRGKELTSLQEVVNGFHCPLVLIESHETLRATVIYAHVIIYYCIIMVCSGNLDPNPQYVKRWRHALHSG